MIPSETKGDDTLKQIHFPTSANELQVGMLGGLKHFISSLATKHLELLGSTVPDYLHKLWLVLLVRDWFMNHLRNELRKSTNYTKGGNGLCGILLAKESLWKKSVIHCRKGNLCLFTHWTLPSSDGCGRFSQKKKKKEKESS